jgi:uncharacterized membrane protein
MMGTLADEARATARQMQGQALAQLRRELKQARQERDAARRDLGQLLHAIDPGNSLDPDALAKALHWIERMHHIGKSIIKLAQL